MARKRILFTTSMNPIILDAARKKSDETSIPLSAVVERYLAFWVNGGELPSKQPISSPSEQRLRPGRPKS